MNNLDPVVPWIADFHTHHVAPGVEVLAPHRASAELAATWPTVASRTGDLGVLLRETAELGVAHRVLSAPPGMVTPWGERTPMDTLHRINDHLAEVVSRHPGVLSGLASVDAFTGDTGAEEVRRAITNLGLQGVVLDCATSGELIGSDRTLPTLRTAAELGVPVFVHPVSEPVLTGWFDGLGRLGTSLARSGACSAALVHMLLEGVLDELPTLRYVTPMLAAPGALLAASTDLGVSISAEAGIDARRHVYLDTMGFAPSAVRFAAAYVGDDHVLVGSDWPVGNRSISAERVATTLEVAGLAEASARRIAGGTAAELLDIPDPNGGWFSPHQVR